MPSQFFLISRPLVFVLACFLCLPANSSAISILSKETELAMGRGTDKEVIARYGIYQDKELQLYVNKIGQKLIRHLANKEFSKFFFKVVDSSETNAFALPGGYIYVTRGLLAILNNEAELACVLGHEIAHVTSHHGAKAMVRAIGASILSIGGAIASPKYASKWLLASTQMFKQINLGYGREAEMESDAHGVVNAFEAGYNPNGMTRFLKYLRQKEMFSGQSYHSYQATHPETKERILKMEAFAASLFNRGKKVVNHRNQYLSKIEGIDYGGKRYINDKRKYKKMEQIVLYEVQPGDTFASIAVKEFQEERKAMEIAILNGLKDTDRLKPGLIIKLTKIKKPRPDINLEINADPDADTETEGDDPPQNPPRLSP